MQRAKFPSQLKPGPVLQSARLLAVLGLLVATSARAQQPFISVSPGDVFVGAPAPGTGYTVEFTVFMFGASAPLSVSALTPANRMTSVTSITPAFTVINVGQMATITVTGVVPSGVGAWTENLAFRYSNSSGPVTLTYQIRGDDPSSTPTTKTYWVGVIPNDSTCPPGSPLLSIHMDDEDTNNTSTSAGWMGATTSSNNTTFRFCRVNGLLFKPLASTDAVTNHYAVLRVGNTCPNGSLPFWRIFHNQSGSNANWDASSSGDEADLGPNDSDLGGNTVLHFCLFKAATSIMTEFPLLGIQYGVFAASDFSKAMQTGWVFTDDEDTLGLNGNDFRGDEAGKRIVAPTSSGGRNTTLHMARVSQGPVARCTVSPTLGTELVFAAFNNDGSFARNGRTLTQYAWRFSDGTTASGPGPYTRRLGVGNHTGTLTVTDNRGEQGSATCSVKVLPNCGTAPIRADASEAGLRDPCPL